KEDYASIDDNVVNAMIETESKLSSLVNKTTTALSDIKKKIEIAKEFAANPEKYMKKLRDKAAKLNTGRKLKTKTAEKFKTAETAYAQYTQDSFADYWLLYMWVSTIQSDYS